MSSKPSSSPHRNLLERLLGVTAGLRQVLASLEEGEPLPTEGTEECGASSECTSPVDAEPPVSSASDVNDTLEALALEHRRLNEALREAGPSEDPGLLPLFERALQESRDILPELEAHRNRTLQALSAGAEQKRRHTAYTREENRFASLSLF